MQLSFGYVAREFISYVVSFFTSKHNYGLLRATSRICPLWNCTAEFLKAFFCFKSSNIFNKRINTEMSHLITMFYVVNAKVTKAASRFGIR